MIGWCIEALPKREGEKRLAAMHRANHEEADTEAKSIDVPASGAGSAPSLPSRARYLPDIGLGDLPAIVSDGLRRGLRPHQYGRIGLCLVLGLAILVWLRTRRESKAGDQVDGSRFEG
jgi:hypothetical protein